MARPMASFSFSEILEPHSDPARCSGGRHRDGEKSLGRHQLKKEKSYRVNNPRYPSAGTDEIIRAAAHRHVRSVDQFPSSDRRMTRLCPPTSALNSLTRQFAPSRHRRRDSPSLAHNRHAKNP
jgi:hypothetical protein